MKNLLIGLILLTTCTSVFAKDYICTTKEGSKIELTVEKYSMDVKIIQDHGDLIQNDHHTIDRYWTVDKTMKDINTKRKMLIHTYMEDMGAKWMLIFNKKSHTLYNKSNRFLLPTKYTVFKAKCFSN